MQGITIGTNPPLTPNAYRVDLVVGRNLTVDGGGGSVPNGAVTYGGTLTPTGTLTALGGLHPGQPPFDFAAEATTLSERSAQWADLAPNGTIAGPSTTCSPAPTPCATCSPLPTAQLQGAGKITIDVAAWLDDARQRLGIDLPRRLYGIALAGATPQTVLWNFPSPPRCSRQRPGLAGNAARARTRRSRSATGNLSGADHSPTRVTIGQLRAWLTIARSPVLPPRRAERNLEGLAPSLCTDPVTNHHTHAP